MRTRNKGADRNEGTGGLYVKKRGESYDRVLASIYSSSFIYSIIVITVVAILEVFMLCYSVINKALYGAFLWTYRTFYIALLSAALAYIVLSLFAKKDIENRYRWLEVANPVYILFFFAWALGITYYDYTHLEVIDTTVFMTFSLIIPLGFFVLPQVYGIIVILADAAMTAMLMHASGAASRSTSTPASLSSSSSCWGSASCC